MKIKLQLQRTNEYVVVSPKGNKYNLLSLGKAIRTFNKRCPIKGYILNQRHIQQSDVYSHITNKLVLENDYLEADIDLMIKIENPKIKPILITPLTKSSGVINIIGIRNICIL